MSRETSSSVNGVLLDDDTLGLHDFAHTCAVEPHWVIERVESGLLELPAQGDGVDRVQWRFASAHVVRARRMAFVERTMDANPELAALVADLEEEIARLRRRLGDCSTPPGRGRG